MIASIGRYIALFLSVLCFGYAGYALVTRSLDESALKAAVAGQIISRPGTGLFVEEMNGWVYRNKGFRKNNSYFGIEALGPTPRQILDQGGDCADKSRLLATLLRLHGIDATLVTLMECPDCRPAHVVVEARYGQGWMAADPVFDLVFPDGEFTYFGVEDLRKDPSILESRLDRLITAAGRPSKLNMYLRRKEHYSFARYVNWDKHPWLKAVSDGLDKLGIEHRNLRRPWFFEDPQLLVAILAGAAGLFFGAVYWLLRILCRSRPAAAGSGLETGTLPIDHTPHSG